MKTLRRPYTRTFLWFNATCCRVVGLCQCNTTVMSLGQSL